RYREFTYRSPGLVQNRISPFIQSIGAVCFRSACVTADRARLVDPGQQSTSRIAGTTLAAVWSQAMPQIQAAHVVVFYLFDIAETIDLQSIPELIGSRAIAARLAPKPATPALCPIREAAALVRRRPGRRRR